MSSYSFQGHSRTWTPRDEEENRAIFSARKQETGIKITHDCKAGYVANADSELEKWKLQQSMQLLRLYGAHHCLWDLNDPDNRNRKLRCAALIDITAAMGAGITRTQVLQKIAVLRATYRYEKRRIKQRIRNGKGARTKLKWFALADVFLRNVPRTRKIHKDEQDTDSDLDDTVVFTIDPAPFVPLDEALADDQSEWEGNEVSPYMAHASNHDFESLDGYLPTTSLVSKSCNDKKTDHLNEELESTSPNPLDERLQRVWSSSESLVFVQLLRDYPILWNKSLKTTKDQQQKAMQELANKLQISFERIRRRVETFNRTCETEQLKMSQNHKYQPGFVWWPTAAEFILPYENRPIEPTNFVDANEPLPATPLTECSIKKEPEESQVSVDLWSTNPIPSVAPASVMSTTVEEALETLFNKTIHDCSEDIKTEHTNDNSMELDSILFSSTACETATSTTAASTKLIWDGLEDDLLEGKWALKHSVKFLRLYGAHRCLWDLNDVDYRSRELRNAAIEDIAAAMGYGLNADYVAKKIKIFRITYMQHRKRILEAKKQGKEPDIQLRWFPLADSFLRPHIGLRSIKEHENEIPQFAFQYVYANLNLIDPALLTDFIGKGTQNTIDIGNEAMQEQGFKEYQNKREIASDNDAEEEL